MVEGQYGPIKVRKFCEGVLEISCGETILTADSAKCRLVPDNDYFIHVVYVEDDEDRKNGEHPTGGDFKRLEIHHIPHGSFT
jgi:hypothetical protein